MASAIRFCFAADGSKIASSVFARLGVENPPQAIVNARSSGLGLARGD
jgi:hypothetical protein